MTHRLIAIVASLALVLCYQAFMTSRLMLDSHIDIYSNEFGGSVNPTQFPQRQPYQPKGWWDSFCEVK